MNKYLMMSAAAAVLAGTTGATASNVRGGGITLSNGCGLTIYESKKATIRYSMAIAAPASALDRGLRGRHGWEDSSTCPTTIPTALVSP